MRNEFLANNCNSNWRHSGFIKQTEHRLIYNLFYINDIQLGCGFLPIFRKSLSAFTKCLILTVGGGMGFSGGVVLVVWALSEIRNNLKIRFFPLNERKILFIQIR